MKSSLNRFLHFVGTALSKSGITLGFTGLLLGTPTILPAPGDIRWSYTNSLAVNSEICITSADLAIFAASTATNSDIVAIRADSGRLVWRVPLPEDGVSTVAESSSKRLFVVSRNSPRIPTNAVYCLDAANGRMLWRHSQRSLRFTDLAVGPSHLIVVGGQHPDLATGALFAFRELDGAIAWKVDIDGPLSAAPVIGVNGLVYVPIDHVGIQVLDLRSGAPLATSYGRWTPKKRSFTFNGLALNTDGSVYASVNYPPDPGGGGFGEQVVLRSPKAVFQVPIGTIVRFAPGSLQADWEQHLNYHVASPILSSTQLLLVGTSGTATAFLFAFDSAGAKRWQSGLDVPISRVGHGSSSSLVLGSENLLYLVGTTAVTNSVQPKGVSYASTAALYALRADSGVVLWKRFARQGFSSNLAMTRTGDLVIGDGNMLVAIETASHGLANAPWPKVSATPGNTGGVNVGSPPVSTVTLSKVADSIQIGARSAFDWPFVVETSELGSSLGNWKPAAILTRATPWSLDATSRQSLFFRLRASP